MAKEKVYLKYTPKSASEIYEIINSNFQKQNGVGDYDGIESYDTFLDLDYIINSAKERKFMKFTNNEVHDLVLYWQQTQDSLVATALFEHYLLLTRKLSLKYAWAYNGLQITLERMDSDMLSEAFIILDKCLNRFELIEGGTFTAYYCSELRNHFMETARRKYFNLAKMPSVIFRTMRKKLVNDEHDDYPYLKRVYDNGLKKDGSEMDTDLLSMVEDPRPLNVETKLINESMIQQLYRFIREEFPERDSVMYILSTGVYQPYTQKRLGELFNLSAGVVSKRLKAIHAYLLENEETTREIITQSE